MSEKILAHERAQVNTYTPTSEIEHAKRRSDLEIAESVEFEFRKFTNYLRVLPNTKIRNSHEVKEYDTYLRWVFNDIKRQGVDPKNLLEIIEGCACYGLRFQQRTDKKLESGMYPFFEKEIKPLLKDLKKVSDRLKRINNNEWGENYIPFKNGLSSVEEMMMHAEIFKLIVKNPSNCPPREHLDFARIELLKFLKRTWGGDFSIQRASAICAPLFWLADFTKTDNVDAFAKACRRSIKKLNLENEFPSS